MCEGHASNLWVLRFGQSLTLSHQLLYRLLAPANARTLDAYIPAFRMIEQPYP